VCVCVCVCVCVYYIYIGTPTCGHLHERHDDVISVRSTLPAHSFTLGERDTVLAQGRTGRLHSQTRNPRTRRRPRDARRRGSWAFTGGGGGGGGGGGARPPAVQEVVVEGDEVVVGVSSTELISACMLALMGSTNSQKSVCSGFGE
jgi:hypothetical protein